MNSSEVQGLNLLIKGTIKVFEKLGMGLLFIILGLIPTLIKPLITLAVVGSGYFRNGNTPWTSISAGSWIVSIVCIVLGVMLFIRKYNPSVKIPEIAYAIAFGVIALFAFVDFIEYFSIPQVKNLKHYQGDIKIYYTMLGFYNGLTFFAFSFMVALLFFKRKMKKFAYVPALAYALGVVLYGIGAVVMATGDYHLPTLTQVNYISDLIYGVLFILALTFFALFFVAMAVAVEEAKEAVAELQKAAEEKAEKKPEDNALKLSPEQREQLQNAKDLFELGAISKEEYEAEKIRIMNMSF